MVRKACLTGVGIARARSLVLVLVISSALVTGCGIPSGGAGGEGADVVGTLAATQESEPPASSPTPSSDSATVTGPARVATNGPLDYCFAYPNGYTLLTNDSHPMEVVGPQSGSVPHPAVAWIDAADAQGRSAQDVAEEEVEAFGGSPPRSTVMLGGDEALVLDGMPGQDAIRKVYIVHDGLLYTLSFTPYRSGNAIADAQMETLFASITSSWVWLSSGAPCPAAR